MDSWYLTQCLHASPAALPEEARPAHFIKLWTLKEAYVKAVGRGINAPPGLQGFSYTMSPQSGNQPDVIHFCTDVDKEALEWEFALLQPTETHVAAICCQKNDASVLQVRAFEADTSYSERALQPCPTLLVAQGSYSSRIGT